MATRIPYPPALPFVGNFTGLEAGHPSEFLARLAKRHGEIYGLKSYGESYVCISTVELAREVLDERGFYAAHNLSFIKSKDGKEGLSQTSKDETHLSVEKDSPASTFDPSVKPMFEDMVDVVSQLVLKWERFGAQHEIDLEDDGTRLALDTVALCTSKHRLNSFYTDKQPMIVAAMSRLLHEANKRVFKPRFVKALPFGSSARYRADTNIVNEVVNRIVRDGAENSAFEKHPLDSTLLGPHSQTGQAFQNAGAQTQILATWAVGHEATANMLSSTIGHILRHPEVHEKIRKEVDTVLGREPIKYGDLDRLLYLTGKSTRREYDLPGLTHRAVWREGLRLTPGIPVLVVRTDEDKTIGNGKYLIKQGTNILVLAEPIARDPAFWGDDSRTFNPDRMLNGQFEALPQGAWIPFGRGAHERVSLYAWQQALVTLAVIFQKFEVALVDTSPKHSSAKGSRNIKIRVTPRKDAPSFSWITASVPPARPVSSAGDSVASSTEGVPLYIYYGSNTGSCEGFAQTLVARAARNGFRAVAETLDTVMDNLPKDGPVVLITASFEGEPADNAGRFVKALTSETHSQDLGDVSFAVFGAGNHEWARTYQRIPRLIDATLEKRGAKRLMERGEGDAGGDSFAESFYDWEEKLWETLSEKYGTNSAANSKNGDAEIQFVNGSTDRASALRQPDAKQGMVLENRLLTAPGVPPKHHIEFKLPDGMTYQSGNYLAILPLNPPEYVQRALSRFKVLPEQQIVLNMVGPTTLPTGRPVSVAEILSGFVEIGQFANKRNISTLLEYASDPSTRNDLESMFANFKKGGKKPNKSMLDLLEQYPDIEMPLAVFITALPPMRIRQYTISSSPLWNPGHATLTVGVVVQGEFRGVGSNYLGSLRKGDQVLLAVRPSAKAFHPPADPTIPMMLFAAGSGLAPFRGFLQERAMQLQAGRQVAKSVLYFGCRTPEEDYLYGDQELAEWSKLGIVDLRPAFSRAPEKSGGNKYVQIRIWEEREMIHQYFDQGAKFYTCGGSHIAAGIREAFIRIMAERLDGDQTKAEEMFRKIQFERYATPRFT